MIQRKVDFTMPVHLEFPVPNQYSGEVGIEIEVEGQGLPRAVMSYWSVHRDGSLRGESAEFVFIKPANRKVYGRYLDYLTKVFKEAGSVFDMSPRTSVHVHVNMRDQSLIGVYNYIICYLIVEDLLTHHAGPTRVGNVFCLRAGDAEFFIDWLVKAAKTGKFCPDQKAMRYTSVNVCAVPKFNSVEFRALRGTVDMEIIKGWVEMLLQIKDAAMKYENPMEIMSDFSRKGPGGFLEALLPANADALKQLVPNWEDRLWNATRLVQEIAYACPWEKQEKKKGRFFPVGQEEENEEPEWVV